MALIVLSKTDLTTLVDTDTALHWGQYSSCVRHWGTEAVVIPWHCGDYELTDTDAKEASSQASESPLLPLIRRKYCNWLNLILNSTLFREYNKE